MGSLRYLGAEKHRGYLDKYPHFCLHALSTYPVFICAPEHTDLNTKIKPHDFLCYRERSETKLPHKIAYLNKLNSCVPF